MNQSIVKFALTIRADFMKIASNSPAVNFIQSNLRESCELMARNVKIFNYLGWTSNEKGDNEHPEEALHLKTIHYSQVVETPLFRMIVFLFLELHYQTERMQP